MRRLRIEPRCKQPILSCSSGLPTRSACGTRGRGSDFCRALSASIHDRVALIVNRHSRRLHHSQAEIEWALGLATAALIPNGPRCCPERSLDAAPADSGRTWSSGEVVAGPGGADTWRYGRLAAGAASVRRVPLHSAVAPSDADPATAAWHLNTSGRLDMSTNPLAQRERPASRPRSNG